MTISTLKDIDVNEIRYLHSANKQSLGIAKRLVKKAKNADITAALEASPCGQQRRHGHAKRSSICAWRKGHGRALQKHEGSCEEAKVRVFDKKSEADCLNNIMIMRHNQIMNHYALARCGSVAAYAKQCATATM